MNSKVVVINALVAALYFVVTAMIAPFGFLNIQFRLSEMFNHLIVFNKKYFYGIVLGVVIANLVYSPTKADLIFGVGHTVLSLLITIYLAKYIKNKITLMLVNSIVFSFNMFIIAIMLKIFVGVPEVFGFLWFTLGLSEFLTMAIAIIIIVLLNKRLKFKDAIE